MDLASRTAVITGASRGLGAGVAQEFHRRGLRLALCSRTEPVLPAGEHVLTARLDVADPEMVQRFAVQAAEHFGTLDLWINNAGVLEPIGPLRDLATEEYRRHLEVNVLGVFGGTRAFVRHRRAAGGGGVLVNISSGAGRNGYAGWSAYCAAKAAVDLMTECVALEERDSGLRAYALAPGVIDTQMQELIRRCTPDQFPTVEKFRELKASGAFNTPELVAGRILDLAFGDWRPSEVRLDLRTS